MVFLNTIKMVFLNINDTLSIFDITKKELNLEIYLEDPLLADKYKEEIIILKIIFIFILD